MDNLKLVECLIPIAISTRNHPYHVLKICITLMDNLTFSQKEKLFDECKEILESKRSELPFVF